jgi:uncharacterized membrane protein YphA (DoxX/SURF4 family)
MKTIFRQHAVNAIVILLILLFTYAASSKIMDFSRFEATIGKSPLITEYSMQLAILVPAFEIIISLMLLIPTLKLIGLYLSFGLMLLFTLYISFLLVYSPYVPCSCGGILNDMGWTEHLIFNILFTAIAFTGILLSSAEPLKNPTSQNLI